MLIRPHPCFIRLNFHAYTCDISPLCFMFRIVVRFAYSLVNDEDDLEEEPEQGPNKNFGKSVHYYNAN